MAFMPPAAPLPPPIVCVVGARPNYMKVAPILRAFERRIPPQRTLLVHTGQHYEPAMNGDLFAGLELRAPDVNLGVGSASHAVQTAEVMLRFEPVLDEHGARAVVVVGDVNSTLACALVAAKRNIPVVHVEAGLRSYDRRMPEEINRVLTDQIADVLYTTERSAEENLAREGIDRSRVVFVGNVMIDSLRASLPRAVSADRILRAAGAGGEVLQGGYGVVTLHRPSNVDRPATLRSIIETLQAISRRLPLVLTLHPRTRASLERFGLLHLLDGVRLVALPPQGYLEMLGLLSGATLVLTDSGGVQEETTALGVPCLTLRENTERPITITQGTNLLVGTDPAAIVGAAEAILSGKGKTGRLPEGWDGHAAVRLTDHLSTWLDARDAAAD
jgi:UDP-N-acetylglucosamine 2-epimerase (non-hydrolysing)